MLISMISSNGSQLLEDEEPDYAAMMAETIYILQGPLSLEVVCDGL